MSALNTNAMLHNEKEIKLFQRNSITHIRIILS